MKGPLSALTKLGRSRFAALGAGFILAASLLGGSAYGQASGDQFTGCLKNGTLTQVAIGTSPLAPCKAGETQVSWFAQGSIGADGATWFSGATLPDAGLGDDDDLYLHLASGDVFVKESGTWVTKANLGGSQGPAGDPGPPGDQGPPGPTGGNSVLRYVEADTVHTLPTSGNLLDPTEVVVANVDLPNGLYINPAFEVVFATFHELPAIADPLGFVCRTTSGISPVIDWSGEEQQVHPSIRPPSLSSSMNDPHMFYEVTGGGGVEIQCWVDGFFGAGSLGAAEIQGLTFRITRVEFTDI